MAVFGLSAACSPREFGAGPPVGDPALDDTVLVARDGAELPVRTWQPKPPEGAWAVVVAVHGFNDYSNFFHMPGEWLAERGVISYAYDQRGFGGAPHRGRWPGIDTLASDLEAMVAAVRRRHPDLPVHLLGASMGGAVIMTAVTRPNAPRFDSLILSGPAVWGRSTMPWYQKLVLELAAHTFPGMNLTGKGLGKVPSSNREMLRALSRDPKVIKETRVEAIYGLVNLMDAAAAAAAYLPGPALVLYGERDEIVPPSSTEAMIERLPGRDGDPIRIAAYPEGYHMLLRDLQAETVWRDVLAFLRDPDGRLPSGAEVGPPDEARAQRDN